MSIKNKNRINKYILKVLLCFLVITLISIFITKHYCVQNINNGESIKDEMIDEVKKSTNVDEYILSLQEYVNESDLSNIEISEFVNSLMKNGNIEYKNVVVKILSIFWKEVAKSISGVIQIFIIVIVMAILSALELDEKSDVVKLVHLVCLVSILIIMVGTFKDIIGEFKKTITTLTTLMQIVSPFLMGVILSTGRITSIGVIEPLLLFLASAIGFVINYIVIPFICIALSLNIISCLSDNLNLGKMSKLFSSASVWMISIMLTVFLGILSLETTFTASVDNLAIKTTQTAISNFVPVVGKFFSDSFETVIGATHVIANAGGIIGIIVMVIVVIVPIIKILCIMMTYFILVSFVEPICKNEQITKLISSFAVMYKTLLGIIIGISILCIISTGIIINITSKVTV